MKEKRSMLADEIVQDWQREHYWKKLAERINKNKKKEEQIEIQNKQ